MGRKKKQVKWEVATVFRGRFLCMCSLQRKGPRGGGEIAASGPRANVARLLFA